METPELLRHFVCIIFACTHQDPYILSGLVPTGFRSLLCFFGHVFRVNQLFINFRCAFFMTDDKIQETIIFHNPEAANRGVL